MLAARVAAEAAGPGGSGGTSVRSNPVQQLPAFRACPSALSLPAAPHPHITTSSPPHLRRLLVRCFRHHLGQLEGRDVHPSCWARCQCLALTWRRRLSRLLLLQAICWSACRAAVLAPPTAVVAARQRGTPAVVIPTTLAAAPAAAAPAPVGPAAGAAAGAPVVTAVRAAAAAAAPAAAARAAPAGPTAGKGRRQPATGRYRGLQACTRLQHKTPPAPATPLWPPPPPAPAAAGAPAPVAAAAAAGAAPPFFDFLAAAGRRGRWQWEE